MSNPKPLQSLYGFDANNNRIINVADPSLPNDVVTLKYFLDNPPSSDQFITRTELVSPAGSSLVGVQQSGTGAVVRTADSKMRDMISVKDFGAVGNGIVDDTQAFIKAGPNGAYIPKGTYLVNQDVSGIFVAARDATVTGSGFVYIARQTDHIFTERNVTITVGPGGNYSTLNAALVFAHRTYAPSFNTTPVSVTINLLSGFVMAEQIRVDAVSMNFIRIKSVAPSVLVNSDSFTFVDSESRYPVFHVDHGGRSPIIGVLFNVRTDPTYTKSVCGFTATNGGVIEMLPGSGITNAERGIAAYYSGEVYCCMGGLTIGGGGLNGTEKGVNLMNTRGRAIMASYGARVNLPRAQVRYCGGDVAVYVIWNSFANIYESDIRNAAVKAVYVRDGSIACAREVCVSGSGENGFHALHCGTIDARYHANQWSMDGASNCGGYAVLASYNSHIDCSELPCSNNLWSAAIHASGASTIVAERVITSNSHRGVFATGASRVYASGAISLNCDFQGMRCDLGSTINAVDADVSNSNTGFHAESGGLIVAQNGVANNCVRGLHAQDSGQIVATGVTATACTERAVSCINGSEIDVSNGNVSGALSFGITCRDGSKVHARNTNAINVGGNGVDLRGTANWVDATGSTGNLTTESAIPVTPNQLTVIGVAFR